jgi:hypothetical protein
MLVVERVRCLKVRDLMVEHMIDLLSECVQWIVNAANVQLSWSREPQQVLRIFQSQLEFARRLRTSWLLFGGSYYKSEARQFESGPRCNNCCLVCGRWKVRKHVLIEVNTLTLTEVRQLWRSGVVIHFSGLCNLGIHSRLDIYSLSGFSKSICSLYMSSVWDVGSKGLARSYDPPKV